MKKLFLFISLTLCFQVFSATEVNCTHPEVCRLIEHTTLSQIKTNSIVVINGDPHEFEPNSGKIKELITSKVLITGPLELHPWLKRVIYLRQKNSALITFTLKINEKYLAMYGKNESEALSHFWLYPEIFCDMKNQLANMPWITNQKIKTNTDCSYKEVLTNLTLKLNNLNAPLVLTHNALLPLLKKLAPSTLEIISLKGSGHHDEVAPSAIKQLYDVLKKPKIFFIAEKSINIPLNIKNKIRPSDIVINIDTGTSSNLNNTNSEFPILFQLIDELKP
jgi:ABC-type Zn uptake system ZnuABC Zn-binding protein ZnuA